ncbi:pilus assembly protein PilM [Candidatus Sumerlaeota bacterium]|nr:pilus assembly protein PilM [Candidatus Sumerlaeota bacterium]
MANLKRCLGVDLGANSVKVVELRREGDAVRIVRAVTKPLDLLPNSPPEERAEATSAAVRELLREEKIALKQAVFSVPGQSVFIKRVRLPRTTEERLHRIINYEARQQIPFPLDKTLLEFQIFDEPGDPQVEVLLVAIKRDFIESFMRTITRCRLKPVAISVSSLALFNYHLFDGAAPDLLGLTAKAERAERRSKGKRKRLRLSLRRRKGGAEEEKEEAAEHPAPQMVEEEDTDLDLGEETDLDLGEDVDFGDFEDLDLGVEDVKAFLNIGATTLDIVIARFGKRKSLGFTRSVPIAGNEMTKLVMDRLRLESFAEAEELKCTQCVAVSDGVDPGSLLPNANAEASNAATALINRLVAEIRRTLDFFVSQPDGVTVDSVVISGGASQMPNLGPYIEDKIGLLVERAEGPTSEHLVTDAQPREGWHGYFPAIGLALSGMGLGKIAIDFLPTNLKDIRQFKGKLVEIAILAGCLAVSVGFGMQMGEANVEWYDQRIQSMQQSVMRAQPIVNDGEQALEARRRIKTQFGELAKMVPWREYWAKIYLEVISNCRPSQVFLTNVEMTGYGQILIQGRSFTPDAIATYAQRINQETSAYIQTGEDPATQLPMVEVYTDPIPHVTQRGETQTGFTLFMRTHTRTSSQSVPYRDLSPRAALGLQQDAMRGGAFPGDRRGQQGNRRPQPGEAFMR